MKRKKTVDSKKPRIHPDLMIDERTVTARMVEIIQNADKYKSVLTLKKDILNILDDETTYLSDKKRNEYKMNLEKKNSIPSVLCYVTNIFLMGCNLGVS